MRKLLCAFCLLALLFALVIPLSAQDVPYIPDTIGSIPSETEPTNTITVSMISAIQTKMFMPKISDNGVVTDEVPLLVVQAAAASQVASFGPFNRRLIPIELQSWWMPAYGHVHTGVMLPFADTVSGVLTIPVRIVMHDNPGRNHLFTIGLEDPSVGHRLDVAMGNLSCAVAVCAWGFNVQLDTRTLKDGCRELRIKSYINTPDGKQMITSSGVPVLVRNGGPSSDYNNACVTGQMVGRGWYTSINYINAIFEHVPTAPVSGTITIGFRAAGEASSRLLVELDKSHFIPAVGAWPEAQDTAGTVLFDQLGNFTKFQHIQLDTTKLTNGWHSLSAKSFSAKTGLTNGIKNTEVGVAKYWMYISNP